MTNQARNQNNESPVISGFWFRIWFVILVSGFWFCSKTLADDAPSGTYKLLKSVTVGGDGGWDYIAVDPNTRHLYIPRSDRIDVFDVDSLVKIGEIPDTPNVHGVAWDPQSGHGFTTNRGDPSVTMFDIKTLKVIKKIPVTGKPDGIFFDPFTKRIFCESHYDPNETVIDAADGKVLGTINLGGEPEQGASDGHGHVFINLESASQVAVIDPAAMKVTAKYSLGDGTEPGGLGLDAKNGIIFSNCGNAKMVILDADTGKILATLPTGDGTDSGAFDPATMEAFASNGDGTLTVVKENSPTDFAVEQNVPTKFGARTCTVDPRTHDIILVTAKPTASASTQPSHGHHRVHWAKDSFMILVVGSSNQS